MMIHTMGEMLPAEVRISSGARIWTNKRSDRSAKPWLCRQTMCRSGDIWHRHSSTRAVSTRRRRSCARHCESTQRTKN